MNDPRPMAWHELVVAGSANVVRAFVTGFLAGRGQEGAAFFGAGLDLERADARVRVSWLGTVRR